MNTETTDVDASLTFDNPASGWRLQAAHLQFAVASVHDVDDAVHSETGLSNVGGDNHLAHALRRLLKDLALQVRRQLGVDRQDEQGRDLVT